MLSCGLVAFWRSTLARLTSLWCSSMMLTTIVLCSAVAGLCLVCHPQAHDHRVSASADPLLAY